jgi:hypothetical protein
MTSKSVTIPERVIQAKAKELFDVYQKQRNLVQDTYCTNFEYLEPRIKDAWMAVATRVLTT